MNVLLLGGTGQISSGIVKALLARGAAVTVLNRGQSDDRLGPDVRRLVADRNDSAALERAVASAGPWDAVIDMICFRPDQAAAAVRLFRGRCAQFIFCSTVCVYGNTQTIIPTTEATTPSPHSSYGRDKLACEQLFLAAHAPGEFAVTIFRPSHTFGPGGGIINNLGFSATFVDRLRRGLPVIVSGDGHGLWQSAFADDVGRGFAHAVGRAACFGQTYNIVGDEVVTWDDYTRRTAAALNAPAPTIVHIPSDLLVALDPIRFSALDEIFRYHGIYSNAHLRRDVPEFVNATPYADAVRRTVAWMDAHGKIAPAESDGFDDCVLAAWHSATRAISQREAAS